jgi:hypothetical protein
MAVFAMCSARGSPGVTTAALALTLAWPGRLVLAECDPAGGTILAGYLRGALGDERSIRELAVAELRGEDLRGHWWSQLVDLQAPHRQRLLLPGIADPVQSGALRPLWGRFAEFFTSLASSDGYDLIVDCGRLVAPNSPLPLLSAADVVLLTLRPTLPGMAAAIPAVRALRNLLVDQTGSQDSLRLLVTGPGDQSTRAVAHELDTPVVARLPNDPRSAGVLSFGGTLRTRAPLLQAAAAAHRDLAGGTAAEVRPQPPATPRRPDPEAVNHAG